MKSIVSFIIALVSLLSLVTLEPLKCQSVVLPTTDNKTMLKPVPKELIVTQNVSDSDVVFVKIRCIVHAKYSESELKELERQFNSAEEWNVFYDSYLFYNEDITMFLHKRAIVKTESIKKYIQFIMVTSEKITINRLKSAGKLFFFNPNTGLKQCDASAFDQRKYTKF